MAFLFPAFLLGTLAIAIPIILHLINRDVAPRVAFSDIRFLRRAPVMQARRRRLRELLLLALRVAALLLLAVAFARPFFDTTGLLDRPMTVVALDRSYSMSGPGVFDRARRAARDLIADAPAGHLVGVVAFDDAADVVFDASPDRGAAAAAVELVRPGAGATRYRVAVDAVVELVGSRDGRVVIITDLQRSGWDLGGEGIVPANVTIEVSDVGVMDHNLAVRAVQPTPTGVVGVVFNAGATERATIATLRIDDESVASTEVTLAPGTSEVVFDVSLPPTGVLALAIDDPDGLPADDRRYALLDPPEPASLAIVTKGGRLGAGAFYLERALRAGEEISAVRLHALSPRALTEQALTDHDAVVLVGTEGLDRQGRGWLFQFADHGGGVLIVTGPTLDPALVSDILGPSAALSLRPVEHDRDLSVSVTDPRHPIFRAFGGLVGTLGQVRFRRTMQLGQTDAGRVLARFADGTPALAEYSVGQGRVLVFASDLNNEWNDFPRRPTFVPFVHEVVRYLIGQPERQREFLVADAPLGVDREPGLRRVPASGRRIVLNVDPRESDPSRVTAETFRSRVAPPSPDALSAAPRQTDATAREAEQGYWWYLLLAMAVAFVAETWLGRTMA